MRIRLLSVIVLLVVLLTACSVRLTPSDNNSNDSKSVKTETSSISEENFDDNSDKQPTSAASILQFKNAAGEVVLDASDVETATPTYYTDSYGDPVICVQLKFTDEGAEKFADATKEAAINRTSIRIYVDGVLVSSPSVDSQYAETGITGGEAIISGSFTKFSEAEALCEAINSVIKN